jgi:hypothetical protein
MRSRKNIPCTVAAISAIATIMFGGGPAEAQKKCDRPASANPTAYGNDRCS